MAGAQNTTLAAFSCACIVGYVVHYDHHSAIKENYFWKAQLQFEYRPRWPIFPITYMLSSKLMRGMTFSFIYKNLPYAV